MNQDEDPKPPDQAQKFKDAARRAECDEDEARWDERLRRVAGRHKPQTPDEGR